MSLREKLRSTHSATIAFLIAAVAIARGLPGRLEFLLDCAILWTEQAVADTPLGRWQPKTRMGQRAQSGAVLTVVVIGIIIIIGILVYSEIESSLPTPSNNDLHDASNNSTETFADSMELAPVILLVLIASVILAVVQRFR